MKRKNGKKKTGTSLVEVVVSLAVLSLGFLIFYRLYAIIFKQVRHSEAISIHVDNVWNLLGNLRADMFCSEKSGIILKSGVSKNEILRLKMIKSGINYEVTYLLHNDVVLRHNIQNGKLLDEQKFDLKGKKKLDFREYSRTVNFSGLHISSKEYIFEAEIGKYYISSIINPANQ
ncbi:MAG: hypothetical protein HQM10_17585 [Candidatus Riflebacteria bacterium]|nr:hypothetical protein [Candidatus Riflebacteria bacterium]